QAIGATCTSVTITDGSGRARRVFGAVGRLAFMITLPGGSLRRGRTGSVRGQPTDNAAPGVAPLAGRGCGGGRGRLRRPGDRPVAEPRPRSRARPGVDAPGARAV